MIVYLDILLVENFFVNLFLLTLTMQTIKKKVTAKKLILGASIGSIYVISIIWPQLHVFTATPFKILVALIMVGITFDKKDIMTILKGTGIFILYSVVLAGMTFYLAIQENSTLSPNAMIYNFSCKGLVLSLMIIYLVSHRLVIYVKERKVLVSYVYNTEIYIADEKILVKAFLDTGNELTEPATNLPVMIVENEFFSGLNLENYIIYNIPYSGVGGCGGKLIGIKPDSVKIDIQGNMKEESLILAFCDIKLSKNNDYNGLLPRGIIE
ncbi:MAG: sigma-E processing peptidase SpoIIGA [Clostridium sp.]|uniref:sigma-E processing peptidase SpoIIGA n=1 Tax=Clostridium sp. TaxID=1506 RepID=UPI0030580B79